jgi:hypothetical protein
MSPPNGHANGSFGSSDQHSTAPILSLNASSTNQYTATQIKEFVALLEVPFDPGVIEWRVTNTSKGNGQSRGQVIPYADQRAYTDRLNALFTPASWTRKYTVHTSANFQRAKDQKTTAKVFVTCDLTIFGLAHTQPPARSGRMMKMPALLRKHRRLSEVAPVLGSAAIFTISRDSGLT